MYKRESREFISYLIKRNDEYSQDDAHDHDEIEKGEEERLLQCDAVFLAQSPDVHAVQDAGDGALAGHGQGAVGAAAGVTQADVDATTAVGVGAGVSPVRARRRFEVWGAGME